MITNARHTHSRAFSATACHCARKAGREDLRVELELSRPAFRRRLKGLLPAGSPVAAFEQDWLEAAVRVIRRKKGKS